MNLRLRLIVAFFLLSVVPLGAVTFYTYMSSAKAVREGALAEAEQLTVELTQRMDLVMARLTERVGNYAMSDDSDVTPTVALRVDSAPAPVGSPQQPAPPPSPKPPASPKSALVGKTDGVTETLGDMAMLLNNIRVRGGRRGGPPGGGFPGGGTSGGGRDGGGRGGRSRGEGFGPTPGSPSTADSAAGAQPATAATPDAASAESGNRGRQGGSRGSGPFGRGDDGGRTGGGPDQPFGGRRNGDPAGPGSGEVDDILIIDLMPTRREIERELAGTSDWDSLSAEERKRIFAQANERVLGIQIGIDRAKSELQKRVAAAQQAADAKALEAAKAAKVTPAPRPAPASPAPPAPAAASPAGRTQRTSALSGNQLDVRMERDGEVVQANAELNLTNVLDTVWTPRRRARGEVPFAVARDGQVYAPNTDDRSRIEALGGGVTRPETPPGTTVLGDWIVVTTADPSSGLKFGIARPVGDALNELRSAGARSVGLGLGLIGLALIGIFPLSSRLTRNLSKLSEGVRRIALGDYRARVQVPSHDEIGRLAQAFNQMAEDVEQHQRAAVGQERIKRELELGRQIQHDMLPHGPLHLGLTEISGVSVPAREVGGDFFNYFALGNGEIALLVGDVSGKGVGAALLMANLQASLRTRLALGQDLAALARELDLDIEGNTPGPVYATLFVGILNPDTRELRYVNAGHNPQYILRGGDRLERMYSSGLPVGLLAGHGYTETRVSLAAGDRLFFYTDGCVEAENEAGEMFTTERLEALLLAVAGDTDVLARVEAVVSAFRGTREPFDDATMMVVKVG